VIYCAEQAGKPVRYLYDYATPQEFDEAFYKDK
jgi:hypothetical protein